MKSRANQQDQKFRLQVNHLNSFIGLPMRSGYTPTPSQIREHDRLILERQAMEFEPKKKGLLSFFLGRFQNTASKLLEQITKLWANIKVNQSL